MAPAFFTGMGKPIIQIIQATKNRMVHIRFFALFAREK